MAVGGCRDGLGGAEVGHGAGGGQRLGGEVGGEPVRATDVEEGSRRCDEGAAEARAVEQERTESQPAARDGHVARDVRVRRQAQGGPRLVDDEVAEGGGRTARRCARDGLVGNPVEDEGCVCTDVQGGVGVGEVVGDRDVAAGHLPELRVSPGADHQVIDLWWDRGEVGTSVRDAGERERPTRRCEGARGRPVVAEDLERAAGHVRGARAEVVVRQRHHRRAGDLHASVVHQVR